MSDQMAIGIAVLTVAMNAVMAVADLARAQFVLETSAAARVPESWLGVLGCCKLAGAIGVALGLVGYRYVGIAAAAGLVLFFLGAIGRHVQTRQFRTIPFPAVFLACAAATSVVFAGR